VLEETTQNTVQAKNGLMGYKGNSYMDGGYFYAPYIPNTNTPVVLDPNSFNPTQGILSRYGKKFLQEAQQYYGTTSIGEPEPRPQFRTIDDDWEV
jgi:hypothetical protein